MANATATERARSHAVSRSFARPTMHDRDRATGFRGQLWNVAAHWLRVQPPVRQTLIEAILTSSLSRVFREGLFSWKAKQPSSQTAKNSQDGSDEVILGYLAARLFFQSFGLDTSVRPMYGAPRPATSCHRWTAGHGVAQLISESSIAFDVSYAINTRKRNHENSKHSVRRHIGCRHRVHHLHRPLAGQDQGSRQGHGQ